MQDYDFEKNVDINPDELTLGSHKKIWWKCEKGHSWLAAISKRSMGRNCPYCSSNKTLKGYNDLSTTHSHLAAEWDFDKNLSINLFETSAFSNKKAWWKCEKGHSYETTVARRSRGSGCPICSSKIILPGYNDLSTTHKELVKSWDFSKNNDIDIRKVSKGSEKKVWWKCKKGHSWLAAIYSRSSGVGCPICAKELQTSFPEKALYFYIKSVFPDAKTNYTNENLNNYKIDIYIPSLSLAIEYDGERWHKNIENDIKKDTICKNLGINVFRIREPNCPVLNSYSHCIITKSKKDVHSNILLLFEELKKFGYLKNILVPPINLECDSIRIYNLIDLHEKKNCISKMNPALLKEWDFKKNESLSPNTITLGSDKKVWWKCEKGHSYTMAVSGKNRGRGCPICAGKKILIGYNDFASQSPTLLKYWDFDKNKILPTDISNGSDKKVWWKCEKGHSHECSINSKRAGIKCPYCSGKKVLIGFNDITTTHPEVSNQWKFTKNDCLPQTVSAGSHKKIWWKCEKCKGEWQTSIYNRTLNNSSCPHCKKNKQNSNKTPKG